MYVGQRVMTPHGWGRITQQDRCSTSETDPNREADGLVTLGRFGVRHDVLPGIAMGNHPYKDNVLYYWPREITT